MATLSVDFEWQPVGPIRLADGLRFPRVDEVPGLYRFEVGDEVYVGETDRLARRMNGYRSPGPSQWTNQRINAWLAEVLGAGRAAQLSVVMQGAVVLGGQRRALRLDQKADRVLAEHAALLMEQDAGRHVRNALERGGR